MQMLSRHCFDPRARSIECTYPAGAVAALHAKMILASTEIAHGTRSPSTTAANTTVRFSSRYAGESAGKRMFMAASNDKEW
jgi:hypothetical protein